MMVGKKSISCIIVNCFNDLFIKKRIVPSIKKTTEHLKDWEIEIIIVDNSPGQDFEMEGIKVVKSLPYHCPKAYNTGVKEATKHYIAIFHDDVDILDYNWVLKAISILSEEIYAVSPDLRITLPYKKITTKFYLKEAPLIMEKEKFWEVGGYNEEAYWGYEDVKFSDSIHKHGKKIKKVRLNSLHFDGFSTILADKDKETKEMLKKELLSCYTIKDYHKFLFSKLKMKKVLVFKKYNSPLLWLIMIIKTKSIYIYEVKSAMKSLGSLRHHQCAGTDKIPVEIHDLIMPRTAYEMEILVRDINENRNGELYSKLKKWDNNEINEYCNSVIKNSKEVTFTNIFLKIIKGIKKLVWEN